MMMSRRCSNCSNNGHNSRTCPAKECAAADDDDGGDGGGGVKLFGVRLTPMKKSASMGCLNAMASAGGGEGDGGGASDALPEPAEDPADSGYHSDGPIHASSSSSGRLKRKKGTPWTEEEHRKFLAGLNKLGRGNWRGISRGFVVSRTSTQVASHAQKYFQRQNNTTRRKRRSSLFDMIPNMPMDGLPVPDPDEDHEDPNQLQASQLKDPGSEDPYPNKLPAEPPEFNNANLAMHVVPAFYPAFLPVPFAFWPPPLPPLPPPPATKFVGAGEKKSHEVLRPAPVLPAREPVCVDSMSRLSIEGEAADGGRRMEPSALSLQLMGAPASRLSAFHLNNNPSNANARPADNEGGGNAHAS